MSTSTERTLKRAEAFMWVSIAIAVGATMWLFIEIHYAGILIGKLQCLML